MKIAFVLGDFPSLSETFVLNQITGLMDGGHQVSIFAERRPAAATMHADVTGYKLMERTRWELLPENPLQRLTSLGKVFRWDRHHWRALNPLRGGRESALLRISLRTLWATHLFDGARHFDIVHCHFGAHGVKAEQLRRMGALRGKLVTTFHGDDIVCYPQQTRGNIYTQLFQNGDLFLPVSNTGKQALIAQGCPAERIRVHHMGVDLRRFRAKHHENDGPVKIVTVGRLVEKKGIADAICAVAGLKCKCRYEFTVVGDGPLRASLENLAADLGVSVRFTGAQRHDEIIGLLSASDIFLAPSVTAKDGDVEGIPVSIMEAMASGLPVVSTRHQGIGELVNHDESGLLAEEHDVEAHTRHVILLAESVEQRARMGAAGRKTIMREFDIFRLNLQLEEHYRQLLEGAVPLREAAKAAACGQVA